MSHHIISRCKKLVKGKNDPWILYQGRGGKEGRGGGAGGDVIIYPFTFPSKNPMET